MSGSKEGMITSGFVWGSLSDKLGRRNLLVIGFLLDFLMNFLTGVVSSLPFILLFKYLSGFIVCGPFSIFTIYVTEVFPSKQRDIAVLSAAIFSSLGNITQAALAMWIIPADVPFQLPLKSWQVFHICCGVPSLLCGLGFIFCVESPKFLVEHGDNAKALEVCKTIYTINTGNPPTSYPIKRLQHQISKSDDKKPIWSGITGAVAIFRPPFVKRASLCSIIQLGAIILTNALRLWLPEMLMLVNSSELDYDQGLCALLLEGNTATSKSLSLQQENQTRVYSEMMLVYTGRMLCHIIFILAVNYLGKKKMLVCCSFLGGVCAIIIPLINAEYVFLAACAFISLHNLCFHLNIAIIVSIFPTRVRATSLSTIILLSRIGLLLDNFLIANLIYSFCQSFFYFLALISLGITIAALFVSLEPIAEVSQKDKLQKRSDLI